MKHKMFKLECIHYTLYIVVESPPPLLLHLETLCPFENYVASLGTFRILMTCSLMEEVMQFSKTSRDILLVLPEGGRGT